MESMLLIISFAIFPIVLIIFVIYIIKNYWEISRPKGREESIIRATDKMRVQMLDSVVHELGNIATSLLPLFENIRLSMQKQGLLDEDFNQDLTTIYEQLNRIAETKYDASVFSQLIGDTSDSVNVNECIRCCWRVLRYDKRTVNVSVNMSLSNDLSMLNISSASLMSVIINLFSNALDALEYSANQSSISIETFSSKGNIVIIMSDSGIGMSEDILNKARDAYFTTKEKGKGTGLGLNVIHEVLKSVKGHFEIDSKERVGTTVSLYLPFN